MSDHNASREAVSRNQLYKKLSDCFCISVPTFRYTFLKKEKGSHYKHRGSFSDKIHSNLRLMLCICKWQFHESVEHRKFLVQLCFCKKQKHQTRTLLHLIFHI